MPLTELTPVKPGEPIKASTMNELIRLAVAGRAFSQGFVSSSGVATRGRSVSGVVTPISSIKMQVLETIPAAIWDASTGELEPRFFKARRFVPQTEEVGDPPEYEYTGKFIPEFVDDPPVPVYIRGVSYMIDPINVTADKYRVGLGVSVSGAPWTDLPFYDPDLFDIDDPTTYQVTVELFNVSCTEFPVE